jgi:hypothetical protein
VGRKIITVFKILRVSNKDRWVNAFLSDFCFYINFLSFDVPSFSLL